jgi:SAM-dependent methyltransferase
LTEPRAAETGDASSSLEFAVLREQMQIAAAQQQLQQRGLLDPPPQVSPVRQVALRLLRRPGPPPVLKTWDVQRAVDALIARVDPAETILDMGCFACEVLPAMKRLGYQNLFGIDLNRAVLDMPYGDSIKYTVGDLLATPWPDGGFAAITAISVIEHGVPDEELCREVSRLLKPEGVFIFTTDYWPRKIVTTERMFDLDWRIFDRAEIEALVNVARAHGLHPVSDPSSLIEVTGDAPIHFAGKDYTFLYGAFIRAQG